MCELHNTSNRQDNFRVKALALMTDVRRSNSVLDTFHSVGENVPSLNPNNNEYLSHILLYQCAGGQLNGRQSMRLFSYLIFDSFLNEWNT